MQNRYAPSGIDRSDAEKLTETMQERLYALIDLGMTLKHIHWNVVGPGFIAVHEMLDDQVAKVRVMADEVAERISTLGGIANGLPGGLTSGRSWDDYQLGRGVVAAHLGALDQMYEGVISGHREALSMSGDIDPITEDMFIAQTRTLELFQWFVRAHLENTSGELSTADADSQLDAAAAAATADHLG